MEKQRYERGAEEQNGVYADAYDNVEPEHRIIVAAFRMLHVCQCLSESAALQVAGYCGEYGQHAYHSVIRRRKQPAKEYAEYQV